MASVIKQMSAITIFRDVDEARQFVFDLDGSCG